MDVGLILLQTFLAIFGTIKDTFIESPKLKKFFVVAILIAMGLVAYFQISYQTTEDFKNQYTGLLTTFSNATATSPILEVGNGSFVDLPENPDVDADDFPWLSGLQVNLIGGKANVTMPIRNSDGDEIGQIVNNQWTIYSPQLIQDRNFNDNSLEIKDLKGDVIFQIQLIGNEVRLAGCFYPKTSSGTLYSVNSWLTPSLFLYPSINYPHELNPSSTPVTLGNGLGGEIGVRECLLD
jgi:hypothetical protein